MTPTQQIRYLIKSYLRRTSTPEYRLAKAAGVNQSTLNRFMKGLCPLNTNQLDKLHKFIEIDVQPTGVEIVPVQKIGRPKKRDKSVDDG